MKACFALTLLLFCFKMEAQNYLPERLLKKYYTDHNIKFVYCYVKCVDDSSGVSHFCLVEKTTVLKHGINFLVIDSCNQNRVVRNLKYSWCSYKKNCKYISTRVQSVVTTKDSLNRITKLTYFNKTDTTLVKEYRYGSKNELIEMDRVSVRKKSEFLTFKYVYDSKGLRVGEEVSRIKAGVVVGTTNYVYKYEFY